MSLLEKDLRGKPAISQYCLKVTVFPDVPISPDAVCRFLANKFFIVPVRHFEEERTNSLTILCNRPLSENFALNHFNKEFACSLEEFECRLSILPVGSEEIAVDLADKWLGIIRMSEHHSDRGSGSPPVNAQTSDILHDDNKESSKKPAASSPSMIIQERQPITRETETETKPVRPDMLQETASTNLFQGPLTPQMVQQMMEMYHLVRPTYLPDLSSLQSANVCQSPGQQQGLKDESGNTQVNAGGSEIVDNCNKESTDTPTASPSMTQQKRPTIPKTEELAETPVASPNNTQQERHQFPRKTETSVTPDVGHLVLEPQMFQQVLNMIQAEMGKVSLGSLPGQQQDLREKEEHTPQKQETKFSSPELKRQSQELYGQQPQGSFSGVFPDDNDVLKDAGNKSKTQITEPCSLKVTKLPKQATKERLELFFGKRKYAKNGKVLSVQIDKNANTAIVTFDNAEVVNSISEMERLTFHDHEIFVERYDANNSSSPDYNVLKITGFSPNTSGDLFEMYFESKKKSGAEADKVEVFKENGYVLVTYGKAEDLNTVLQKEHVLAGERLTLVKYEGEVLKTLKVTGFSAKTKFEMMELYFESIKKCGAEAEKVKLSEDTTCYFVTFETVEEAELVCGREHKLDGCKLKVEIYDPSTPDDSEATNEGNKVVKVSGYSDSTSNDHLELYIESKKKFGAVVETFEIKEEENCTYVTLSNADDAELVCQRKHELDGCKLTVELYNSAVVHEDLTTDDVIVKINGFGNKIPEDKIKLYLQNQKKFGAVPIHLEIDKEESCVFVTLSSSEDADKVCKRSHNLQKKQLRVKRYTPLPLQHNHLLVTNINEETSQESLTNFLEGKLDIQIKDVIYNEDGNKAVVTFKEQVSVRKLLTKTAVFEKKKLNGQNLKIKGVPEGKIVKVTNFTEETDEEDLTNYFEKFSTVMKAKIHEKYRHALVHVDKQQDVDIICNKEHQLGSTKLQVEVYQECLGEDGGFRERNVFTQPEPSTIHLSDSDQYKLMFINQTDSLYDSFKLHMLNHHSVVEWNRNNNEVVLACTLQKDTKNARRTSKTWRACSEKILTDYLADLKLKEFIVLKEVLEKVIKKKNSLISDKTQVDILEASDSSTLVVVGCDQKQFDLVTSSLGESIETIVAEFERKQQEVTETIKLKVTFNILQQLGLIDMLKSKHPHIQIFSPNSVNELELKGIVSDIMSVKATLYEHQESIKRTDIKSLTQDQLKLLKNSEVKENIMKEKFQGQESKVFWEVDKEITCIQIAALDGEILEKTISVLTAATVHKPIPMDHESIQLLTKRQWLDHVDGINKTYPNMVKLYPNDDRLTIIAISDIVDIVEQSVISFFEEFTIYQKTCNFGPSRNRFFYRFYKDDVLKLKEKYKSSEIVIKVSEENGISMEGRKTGIKKTAENVTELNSKISVKEKNINTPSYCKFIQSSKGKSVIQNMEKLFRCIVDIEEEAAAERLNSTGNTKNMATFQIKKTKINVVEGDITALNVDVIVNAANEQLQHIGGLAGAIVKKGGKVIQDDCDRYVSRHGSVFDGDCMMSTPGDLPCRKIVHAVGPRWYGGRNEEEKILSATIARTLEMIMTHNLSSVAIPAISTGIFGYPADEATQVIVKAIAYHFERAPNSTIKLIYLIDVQTSSLKHFIKALKNESQFQEINSSGIPKANSLPLKKKASTRVKELSASTGASPDTIPNIVRGEIAQIRADVIVNSTANSLKLQSGAVSSSLCKAAGPALQNECDEKYPNGVQFGDIAETAPGNLPCKRVYHTSLSQYKNSTSEKDLKKLIMKCLKKAENDGWTSVAFPAIGTGNLGFPRDVVAGIFFSTIDDYISQGGSLSAQNIKIVVYPGDVATVQAFTKSQPITHNRRVKEDMPFEEVEDMGFEESEDFHVVTAKDLNRGVDVGNIKLSVTVGNILQADVPIIVNSSNSDLDLSTGAVSKAILKAGKSFITEECQKHVLEMKDKGIVVTPVTGMNCQYIIHVDADRFRDNWKSAIKKCLIVADEKKLKSLAFPALGTGMFGQRIEDLSEAMYKALSTTNTTSLKDVQVVIFQESHLDPFLNGLQNSQKQQNKPGYLKRIKNAISETIGYGSGYSTIDENPMAKAYVPSSDLSHLKEKIVYFYSDKADEIDNAMQHLDKSHGEDTLQQRIDMKHELTATDKATIKDFESEHGVDIKIDDRLDRIIISGLARDVADVVVKVNELQMLAESKKYEKKHAEMLKNVIQWSRIDVSLKEYPAHINKKIEDAYSSKSADYTFKYNSNDHTIDFTTMIETENSNGNKVSVVRQDKIKAASQLEKPAHWTINQGDLNIVVLQTSDPDYQTVVQNFSASGRTIQKVERIENLSLWQQYTAKKRQMQHDLPSNTQIEQPILWHGTDGSSITSINKYGFNRSYCGKNATVHGQGVYFAVNSSYSVNYAKANASGVCQMYQSRVLVGDYTQGNSSYRVPPNNPANNQPFNSLVDNQANPQMYIIFHDSQAYPEYLITFV